MSRDLYLESILDHNKSPRNFGELDEPHGPDLTVWELEAVNPLCGDAFALELRASKGVICDAGFTGSGCAISKASTSMLTEALLGTALDEVTPLCEMFLEMVAGAVSPGTSEAPSFWNADLEVFSEVYKNPARQKCAVLAWETVEHTVGGD